MLINERLKIISDEEVMNVGRGHSALSSIANPLLAGRGSVDGISINRSFAHSSLGFTGNVSRMKASGDYTPSGSTTLQPLKGKAMAYNTQFPKFIGGKTRGSTSFVS